MNDEHFRCSHSLLMSWATLRKPHPGSTGQCYAPCTSTLKYPECSQSQYPTVTYMDIVDIYMPTIYKLIDVCGRNANQSACLTHSFMYCRSTPHKGSRPRTLLVWWRPRSYPRMCTCVHPKKSYNISLQICVNTLRVLRLLYENKLSNQYYRGVINNSLALIYI